MLPLRAYFLRIALWAGVGATLLVWIAMLLGGYVLMRQKAIHHFQEMVQNAGNVASFSLAQKNNRALENYLQHFSQDEDLTNLCIYNDDNRLLLHWQHDASAPACPPLIVTSGISTTWWSVQQALPIRQQQTYLGIIYASGKLASLASFLRGALILLTLLLLLCYVTCAGTSRFMARQIMRQLSAIRHQIECLKEHESALCLIPREATLQEIKELSSSVVALRDHLDRSKISKEALRDARQWHWAILTGLLSGLRHQLDAHSPLLEPLSDYALLVQTERGDALPPAESFDMLHIVNASASRARKHHAKPALVNVTATVQSGMPREWLGHPHILETLLRHLLMIGISRTQSGFVYVRVQALSDTNLHIAYEDSGPAIQPWQLQQWLTPNDMPAPGMHTHISWLLVARLFHRLGGHVTGRSQASGGLLLEGTIPLQRAQEQLVVHPALQPTSLATPPLLLVVEKESPPDGKICAAFARAECLIFVVPTHAQAIEWAVALPFSAIILNDTLNDAKDAAIQRLSHMKADGTLSNMPYWMVTANHSFIESDYWRARNISQLLLLPLSLSVLQDACSKLAVPDAEFYARHDARVHEDFAASIQDSLPQMTQMLMQQVQQFYEFLQLHVRDAATESLEPQAHKVKSAALSLGYFRLAVLMGQIEHYAADRHFPQDNWLVITDCLKDFLEAHGAKTLPNAA